ncbi:MAG: hypothetical protein LBI19_04155 [Oscillospiraceae bacterium]|jgi:hypothetical protein|nr:hypothetical protein [Oscillospiraceae bacterium]
MKKKTKTPLGCLIPVIILYTGIVIGFIVIAGGGVILISYGILFLFGITLRIINPLYGNRKAEQYIVDNGICVEANLVKKRPYRFQSRVRLTYEYKVDGKSYTVCRKRMPYRDSSSSHDDMQDSVSYHEPAKTVSVYYMPGKPAEGVCEDNAFNWNTVIASVCSFIIPVVSLLIYFAVSLIHA